MDYMESVKQLEEKLVLNQQKHDRDGFTDGACNGQVSLLEPFMLFVVIFLKEESCLDCLLWEIYDNKNAC